MVGILSLKLAADVVRMPMGTTLMYSEVDCSSCIPLLIHDCLVPPIRLGVLSERAKTFTYESE